MCRQERTVLDSDVGRPQESGERERQPRYRMGRQRNCTDQWFINSMVIDAPKWSTMKYTFPRTKIGSRPLDEFRRFEPIQPDPPARPQITRGQWAQLIELISKTDGGSLRKAARTERFAARTIRRAKCLRASGSLVDCTWVLPR